MQGGDAGSGELGRYLVLAQVGLEMVVPIVAGMYLDTRFAWGPWGTIVGAVIGLIGGLAHLIYLLNRPGEDGSAPKPPQGSCP
jgi:F0F1-type ATP synthase assembly protein I